MKMKGDIGMVNQQKGVQQDTAYSAVVVNDHMYISPSMPISFLIIMTLLGQKRYRDGDTYDHSLQLHYKQYLVALLFADLHHPCSVWNVYTT